MICIILYLTGLGLQVGMKVPPYLIVDKVIRSLHLVAIELESSLKLYRLVNFSNCLSFCTSSSIVSENGCPHRHHGALYDDNIITHPFKF